MNHSLEIGWEYPPYLVGDRLEFHGLFVLKGFTFRLIRIVNFPWASVGHRSGDDFISHFAECVDCQEVVSDLMRVITDDLGEVIFDYCKK